MTTTLLYGPYASPRVSVGDFISCEIRGLQKVKTFTDAPIPQPIKAGRGCAILVCGDLVRALRVESASAVAHWWAVSTHRVSIWRRELGIDRVTEGTRELLIAGGNMDIGGQSALGAATLRADSAAYSKRNQAHSNALRGRVKTIGKPERQRLGKIGRRGGRSRMSALTPEQRAALAKLGGAEAGKRDSFARRASAIKRWRTLGDVFRYETLRDRLIIDMRLDRRPVSQVAKFMGLESGDVYAMLYDLANRYPMFAGDLMTTRQMAKNKISSGDN